LLSAVAAPRATAKAATAAATATPAPMTEQQRIVAFLGSAIAWYRQLNLENGLVEEPSEALYLTADISMAGDVVKLAFDYANAQANLLVKNQLPGEPSGTAASGNPPDARLDIRLSKVKEDINAIEARIKDLTTRLNRTPRQQRDALARQLLAAQSELELAKSRADFMTTIREFERGNGAGAPNSTLQAQIDELQRSWQSDAKLKPQAAAQQQQASEPNGIVGLAQHLLDLQGKVQTIDQRLEATASLSSTVIHARSRALLPLGQIDTEAEQLTREALGDDRATIEQRKKDFEQLIQRRKLLTPVLLPLTKQEVVLGRYLQNLKQWRQQVMRHATDVLHALLLHLGGLLLLVGLIVTFSMVWRIAADRYVEDANRRRQIMKVRNGTVVILIILILVFNFTTELGALATVLGFAAAGIAVALQDVILSIAGYFRLTGRFGIKHGDRVEVQGVRGEVVEIGILKLTLLELGGDALQSNPTGRLVSIPNSTVFREKFLNHPAHGQMIWREISFTLAPDCDFRVLEKRLLEIVEAVFARYRDNARTQLLAMERLLNVRIDSGRPQSRIRLLPGGLQITLRYPVDARSEAQIADEISRRLLDFLAREPGLRFVPTGAPNIQMIAVDGAQANGGATPAAGAGATTATPADATAAPIGVEGRPPGPRTQS
jgi:small-conductance mechanosensitive channel